MSAGVPVCNTDMVILDLKVNRLMRCAVCCVLCALCCVMCTLANTNTFRPPPLLLRLPPPPLILDLKGNDVPLGTQGELCLHGVQVRSKWVYMIVIRFIRCIRCF